tara:strand:- start:679 stop:888 length:210 start_codon:yes stop_codon:yes gene_type:complete
MNFKAEKFTFTKKNEVEKLRLSSQLFLFSGFGLIILCLVIYVKSIFPLLAMLLLLSFIRKEASSRKIIQ